MVNRTTNPCNEENVAGESANESSHDENAQELCSVRPLGQYQGRYFFLSPSGELRVLRLRELKRSGILSLFEGYETWLIDNFPVFEGRRPATKWNLEKAAKWLIRACVREGLFDSTAPVRGRGVWRSGADLVVHCGDQLVIGGRRSRLGRTSSKSLYPAAPPIAPPADTTASVDDGRQLLDDVRQWRFERPVDAEMLVGWIGAALLGAAPPWRVHVYVTGERGSGKSWLADLVTAARQSCGSGSSDLYDYVCQQLQTERRSRVTSKLRSHR